MIAVDTSAIMAVLAEESEAPRVRDRLARAEGAVVSAGNVLELQFVAARAGRENWEDIEALFSSYRVEILAFDERQLRLAREAALRFGKGKHKARLNYGDCFAYALAKSEGLPLLFVGDDFAKTDIDVA